MRRLLFVTDTYYPDSSATTTIVKRTAESLARHGYSVDVYPAEISGNHFSYPDVVGGVNIIKPDAASDDGYAPVNPSETHPVTDRQVQRLSALLDKVDYDSVFSVAIAFEVNFLAHEALRGRRCAWFPMSYDPYAFNPHITAEQKRCRIRREEDALRDATKVFFLTEFKDDYVGCPFEDKIVWFNLPCIRPIDPDRSRKAIGFDSSCINCVFLGDFYFGKENSDFIFRLFERLDRKIRLYTIGNTGDYQSVVDVWRQRLGDRYVCCGRVSQEEAHNVMLDCDVLVSMGHDSPNMCPSKAIDFVSSGKPILHISKIADCCAKRYLERYPDKYCICQHDELNADTIRQVERFIMDAKSRDSIPFSTVSDIYSDFTMEALTRKIMKELK